MLHRPQAQYHNRALLWACSLKAYKPLACLFYFPAALRSWPHAGRSRGRLPTATQRPQHSAQPPPAKIGGKPQREMFLARHASPRPSRQIANNNACSCNTEPGLGAATPAESEAGLCRGVLHAGKTSPTAAELRGWPWTWHLALQRPWFLYEGVWGNARQCTVPCPRRGPEQLISRSFAAQTFPCSATPHRALHAAGRGAAGRRSTARAWLRSPRLAPCQHRTAGAASQPCWKAGAQIGLGRNQRACLTACNRREAMLRAAQPTVRCLRRWLLCTVMQNK